MGLFSKKKKNEKPEKPKPKFADTLTRVDANLLYDFEDKYYDKLTDMTEKFEYICEDIPEIFEVDKRLKICEKAAAAFHKFRDFCVSKGYGGELYYQRWLNEESFGSDGHYDVQKLEWEINQLLNHREDSEKRLNNERLIYEYGSIEEGLDAENS